MLDQSLTTFLLKDASDRFLRYVRINTQADPNANTQPSSPGQLELGRLLVQELSALDLLEVTLDDHGYVYAKKSANGCTQVPPITFCAHLDTSPSECGENVTPILHPDYDGGDIRFPKNESLVLNPRISPELLKFVGQTIITSSGDTLLGADDKAGIAEIMAALAAFKSFSDLSHPELRIVFTPDEEIGKGADNIDLNRLGQVGYTMDGGLVGSIETECFDAWEVNLTFWGRNIHPGYAKNKMINAVAIAARYIAGLSEWQTPEHTEKKEAFWHLTALNGDENKAHCKLIIRAFAREQNKRQIEVLRQLCHLFEMRYDGLKIELHPKEQYRNMQEILLQHPQVSANAEQAIEATGLNILHKPIRGGTDGARLSFMGMPTPNIFAGGLMFHSKTEWIPQIALQQGAQVIVELCAVWSKGI